MEETETRMQIENITNEEEEEEEAHFIVSSFDKKINKLVVPGDVIGTISDLSIRLGPGLLQNKDEIVVTKCGILQRDLQEKYYWVQNFQKRYVPALQDMVIGVVTERHGENYKVDIGSAHAATLPILAFEGATKKNRPNLSVGSLIYARVVLANKDMEPELACYSIRGKAEGYGLLDGGYLFKCSLNLAYSLLDDKCPILQLLGKLIPYEIAVGMNGRVWVHSGSSKHTILIANAIINSEFLKLNQLQAMVAKLASHLSES